MLKKCQPLALVIESVMERGPIVEEAWEKDGNWAMKRAFPLSAQD